MSLDHPQKEQLIAFGQGKLAADESSSVEQHLELCPECCETLFDLKDDTFVGLVKIAQPSDSDRRMGTPARPEMEPGTTESDKTGTGKSAHPTDGGIANDSAHSATMLVQSGEAVSVDDLPIELQSHPRYRIVELIGRGGMGNVYRAEHRLMNREVALKLINSQLIRHPQAVERFRREVQAAAKLTHPNIVTAYDAEQAGDVHFLVMEFVEGTDLASVVKHRGSMSVAEASECIRQAAEGLQHAHEKGMVHRDIKPHNLMLSAEGQVRILDFGLAGFVTEAAAATISRNALASGSDAEATDTDKPDASAFRLISAAHLTTAGSVMGTPDYIAPEQAKDAHSADIRADIYSLGCTLHFLLTGKPPFVSDNIIAKLKAHAELVPESLTKLRGDVPPELSNIVARMMAKKPAERFQTPAAVAESLAPFAKPAASPPKRRVRTLVAALCLGVAALLAGLIVIGTDRGRLEIQSEVEDVKIVVKQSGEQIEVFDLKTGSQMRWLPTGDYELQLIGRDNDVKLDKTGFKMSRLGRVIVTANWNAAGRGVVRAFSADEKPITQDGVTVDDGGWKITATAARTVKLFEIPNPKLDIGPFFFRAKLKTENVTGRAYMEMWTRFPGKGEFFSKGLHNAISGTNGWAEYEIPFFLKKGEEPDLVKLNVTIEGTGTVWIKDVELRGRTIGGPSKPEPEHSANQPGKADPGVSPLASLKDSVTVLTYLNNPRNNTGGSVPVALLGQQGRVAFRFGTWLVVFEGIACDPKASLLGFSSFNIPLPGSSGEGTIDFGAGDKLPGVLIKSKFADEQNEISINNNRFKLRGKATRVEFDDHVYDATNSLQTIHVARDGTTRLQEDKAGASAAVVPDEKRLQGKWIAVSGYARKKPLTAAELTQLSITFNGERAEFVQPSGPPTPQAVTFTINSNRNPKQIDFVAPGKQESMPGIYQFDGERLKLALIDQDYSRPTNFDPDHRPDHLTAVFERITVAATLGDEERKVLKAAEAFLVVADDDKFDQLHDISSMLAKRAATKEQVGKQYQLLRDTVGKATQRTLQRLWLVDEFPGLPAGRYAAVEFKTKFAERQGLLFESAVLNIDADGQWRVNTYAATLEPLPIPRPKAKPEPGAAIKTP